MSAVFLLRFVLQVINNQTAEKNTELLKVPYINGGCAHQKAVRRLAEQVT